MIKYFKTNNKNRYITMRSLDCKFQIISITGI